MNIHYPIPSNDALSVELDPCSEREPESGVVRAIADWFWQQHGLDLDCDALVVTMVWCGGAEDGRQAATQAPGVTGA
jgi:hypothetical protein